MASVEELTQQLAAMTLARDSVQEQYDQSTEVCKELSATVEQMQAAEQTKAAQKPQKEVQSPKPSHASSMSIDPPTSAYPKPKVKPDKPPSFTGKGNRPDTWLFMVENYFKAMNYTIDSEEAINFAGTLFKDAAATWWQYIDQAVKHGSRKKIESWEEFKVALESEFMNLDVEKQARDKLDNLTQRGPVQDYVRRVRDLAANQRHVPFGLTAQVCQRP